jgi:hypothetical protein
MIPLLYSRSITKFGQASRQTHTFTFHLKQNMRKTLTAICILFISIVSHGQQEIKMDELNKHIGDSITVCTKIYGGIFLDRSKDTPTLLNAGDKYPNAPLTIVIGPETRQKFKEKPEVFYKDKEVCITGKISLYKDKPQIVLYSEKQIVAR